MADYTRLPGVYVKINDGGLRVTPPVSTAPRVLIIGTAGKGPAYMPIEPLSMVRAKTTFGSSGSLLQKYAEAIAGGAENVTLFRVGSEASTITGVGYVSAESPGLTVTFEDHSPTIGDDYYIGYRAGILEVYTSRGTTVYSNDPDDPIDLRVVSISGTNTSAGSDILTSGSTVDFDHAVLVDDLSVSNVTFTLGDDGVDISNRRLFEVCYTAFALLDGYDSDIVVIAGAYADNPNVAYYETSVTGSVTSVVENYPVGDTSVLGWFRADSNINSSELYDYYWSEEVWTDAGAMAVSALDATYLANYAADPDTYPITFASAADRIAKGFREVSFAYLLANYCYQMTKNNNEMIGVIAIRGPRDTSGRSSAKLYDVNRWVGVMPTYNDAGVVTNDGSGLLAFPLTMGCSASRLNNLVLGQTEGRIPGIFATDDEYIDGTVLYDDNNFKIDIGAYISIVGEHPMIVIGNYPYVGPIDGLYAGMISLLDPKDAPTFKPLGSVKKRWRLSKAKHDELIQAKIVLMDDVPIKGYAIVDAMTAATDDSDFRRLTTVRILHLVSQRMRAVTIPFIGTAALITPKKIALATAIEGEYAKLAKRGYLSDYQFEIEISKYDQVNGNVKIYHTFIPALETRRITHTYQFTI